MPFRHGAYRSDTRDHLTTVVIEIVLPIDNLLLMICSKQAVSCHVCFNFSCLDSMLPVLHSGNNPSRSSTKCMSSIFIIFKCAYLKFPVSGRSKQASKQASKHTHTHMRNEVTLVWGSLRLAPIILQFHLGSQGLWYHVYSSLTTEPLCAEHLK